MTEVEFIAALAAIVVVAGIIMSSIIYTMTRPSTRLGKIMPKMRPGETTEQFWSRVVDESDV